MTSRNFKVARMVLKLPRPKPAESEPVDIILPFGLQEQMCFYRVCQATDEHTADCTHYTEMERLKAALHGKLKQRREAR